MPDSPKPLTTNQDGSPCWCDRGLGHTFICTERWEAWVAVGRPPFVVTEEAPPMPSPTPESGPEPLTAEEESWLRADMIAPDRAIQYAPTGHPEWTPYDGRMLADSHSGWLVARLLATLDRERAARPSPAEPSEHVHVLPVTRLSPPGDAFTCSCGLVFYVRGGSPNA